LPELDKTIAVFQSAGYETHIFRSSKPGDIFEHLKKTKKDGYCCYDAFAISGGDGALNILINAMISNRVDVPVCIIPMGTANDFATHLKIPPNAADAAKVIKKGKIIASDVGEANGRYFINVCGAGLFTDISRKIDSDFKGVFGKSAYYMEAFSKLSDITPLKMRITNSKETFEDDIYFFIVLNSPGTGGFNDITSSDASVTDGLFEFIAVKAKPVFELAGLFIKVLKRDRHLDDSNVIYFKDNYISVEPLFENNDFLGTDTDGECGPDLPVSIRCLPGAVKFFVP